MTKSEEDKLFVRVGLLEDTISGLLLHLRDLSDTPQKYIDFNDMLSKINSRNRVDEQK